MTGEEIRKRMDALGKQTPWYHVIQLGLGILTPGWNALEPIWQNIRKVRDADRALNRVTQGGVRVLDLGSRDGMWAFEAEQFEAVSTVVATDIGWTGYLDHLLFCREVLGSKVLPLYNVEAEHLTDGLKHFWRENPGKFDIVQHLGLLYHLPDMMVSLRQARACLKDGGMMLLETAYYNFHDYPIARFNSDGGVYHDKESFWAPNLPCLKGMLEQTGFEPDMKGAGFVHGDTDINRVCLWAKAI